MTDSVIRFRNSESFFRYSEKAGEFKIDLQSGPWFHELSYQVLDRAVPQYLCADFRDHCKKVYKKATYYPSFDDIHFCWLLFKTTHNEI